MKFVVPIAGVFSVGRISAKGGCFIRWSTVPPTAAVGLTAIVSIIIPGRVAIVFPLLWIAPVLLVALLVLLLSPGLLLLEVLLGSFKVALPGGRSAADVDHQRTV